MHTQKPLVTGPVDAAKSHQPIFAAIHQHSNCVRRTSIRQ
ncbi:Uncharacterised protein [Vibrio cholerae]|nr:Uncharacterised protein [Vibrio cholerae]